MSDTGITREVTGSGILVPMDTGKIAKSTLYVQELWVPCKIVHLLTDLFKHILNSLNGGQKTINGGSPPQPF